MTKKDIPRIALFFFSIFISLFCIALGATLMIRTFYDIKNSNSDSFFEIETEYSSIHVSKTRPDLGEIRVLQGWFYADNVIGTTDGNVWEVRDAPVSAPYIEVVIADNGTPNCCTDDIILAIIPIEATEVKDFPWGY